MKRSLTVPNKYLYKLVLCWMCITLSYSNDSSQGINKQLIPELNQVGILSLNHIEDTFYEMQIYVICNEPVAGLQFGLTPKDLFDVIDVQPGDLVSKEFSLHHNKSGTILAFSMSGAVIPASKNKSPDQNIAIKLKLKKKRESKKGEKIKLNPILAAKGGTKINTKDVIFDLNKNSFKK